MKWFNEATGKSIEIFNEDCMPALEKMKESEFELAIVDPPYGIGMDGGRIGKSKEYVKKDWDKTPPKKEYFILLFKKTANQILWGANHYIAQFNKSSSCWIVWDKQNDGRTFAEAELAYTSFKSVNRIIRNRNRSISEKDKINRIHPTQKPVVLYKWLLKNYAKPNDRILDTHLGSGSIAIACWDMGFDLVGYEIDKDYFEATCKRLNDHFNQITLF